MLRHGHPAFRHSHQTAAASKRQAPNGSGTRNMPHVASATGELILRKLVMSSGALASGQGRNLNKVLTTRARNDRRMVNAPPHGRSVSFCTGGRRESRYGCVRMTDVRRPGSFDPAFGLCQQPQGFV